MRLSALLLSAAALALSSGASAQGQNNYGSIYSLYGLGERVEFGSSQSTMLGHGATGAPVRELRQPVEPGAVVGPDADDVLGRRERRDRPRRGRPDGRDERRDRRRPVVAPPRDPAAPPPPRCDAGLPALLARELPGQHRRLADGRRRDGAVHDQPGGRRRAPAALGRARPQASTPRSRSAPRPTSSSATQELLQRTEFDDGVGFAETRQARVTRLRGVTATLGAAVTARALARDDDALTVGRRPDAADVAGRLADGDAGREPGPRHAPGARREPVARRLGHAPARGPRRASPTCPARAGSRRSTGSYEPWSGFESTLPVGGFDPGQNLDELQRPLPRRRRRRDRPRPGATAGPALFERSSYRLGGYAERGLYAPAGQDVDHARPHRRPLRPEPADRRPHRSRRRGRNPRIDRGRTRPRHVPQGDAHAQLRRALVRPAPIRLTFSHRHTSRPMRPTRLALFALAFGALTACQRAAQRGRGRVASTNTPYTPDTPTAYGPGDYCASTYVLAPADDPVQLQLGQRVLPERGLLRGLPLHPQLLDTEPLFTGEDPDDRNYLRMASIYEDFAAQVDSTNRAEKVAYLDSALSSARWASPRSSARGSPTTATSATCARGSSTSRTAGTTTTPTSGSTRRSTGRSRPSRTAWRTGTWSSSSTPRPSSLGQDLPNPDRAEFIRTLAGSLDDAALKQNYTLYADYVETDPSETGEVAVGSDDVVEGLITSARAGSIGGDDALRLLAVVLQQPERIEALNEDVGELRTILLRNPAVTNQVDNPRTLYALALQAYGDGDRTRGNGLFDRAISNAQSNAQRADFYYSRGSELVRERVGLHAGPRVLPEPRPEPVPPGRPDRQLGRPPVVAPGPVRVLVPGRHLPERGRVELRLADLGDGSPRRRPVRAGRAQPGPVLPGGLQPGPVGLGQPRRLRELHDARPLARAPPPRDQADRSRRPSPTWGGRCSFGAVGSSAVTATGPASVARQGPRVGPGRPRTH